jgi:hypothetical protein
MPTTSDSTRSAQSIIDALAALSELETQRPGLTAKLILYTDGEGALTLEDLRSHTFRAAVDFSETADLLDAVRKLSECENLFES